MALYSNLCRCAIKQSYNQSVLHEQIYQSYWHGMQVILLLMDVHLYRKWNIWNENNFVEKIHCEFKFRIVNLSVKQTIYIEFTFLIFIVLQQYFSKWFQKVSVYLQKELKLQCIIFCDLTDKWVGDIHGASHRWRRWRRDDKPGRDSSWHEPSIGCRRHRLQDVDVYLQHYRQQRQCRPK